MYFLLRMGMFHCYVNLPEGTLWQTEVLNTKSWWFGSMLFLFIGFFQVNQPLIFWGVCGNHFVGGGESHLIESRVFFRDFPKNYHALFGFVYFIPPEKS